MIVHKVARVPAQDVAQSGDCRVRWNGGHQLALFRGDVCIDTRDVYGDARGTVTLDMATRKAERWLRDHLSR